MTRYLQCAEQQESASNFSKYCACHEKWISCLILVTHETLFRMRGGTSAIVQTHQILRLPRKMNLMIDPCHTWNAIYNARSNTCHCPNSPNTAPATKNESHDWSLSHMKRYLQCAEQQASLSKLTKYCACHAKWFSKISETFLQNRWNVNYNARPIREWSELDPSWIRAGSEQETVIRNPPRNRGYFSGPPRAFCIEKYNISRSGYHSKFHRILRLPRKVTLQLHRILRLPRKMTRIIDPHNMSHVIYNAQRNSTHRPTSLNTAPATQNETHDWSAWHMKRYLQCAEQQVASSNITKYCACHAKWLSWLILVTYETLFTMRGTTGGILQHHQILRLPRKMILQNFRNISPKQMKRQLQCATDPRMIRAGSELDPSRKPSSATRLATEVTFQDHREHFVLKNTTFRAPAIIPNFTEYCACHEKWHFNFTEYCACHEKWHLNVTK